MLGFSLLQRLCVIVIVQARRVFLELTSSELSHHRSDLSNTTTEVIEERSERSNAEYEPHIPWFVRQAGLDRSAKCPWAWEGGERGEDDESSVPAVFNDELAIDVSECLSLDGEADAVQAEVQTAGEESRRISKDRPNIWRLQRWVGNLLLASLVLGVETSLRILLWFVHMHSSSSTQPYSDVLNAFCTAMRGKVDSDKHLGIIGGLCVIVYTG